MNERPRMVPVTILAVSLAGKQSMMPLNISRITGSRYRSNSYFSILIMIFTLKYVCLILFDDLKLKILKFICERIAVLMPACTEHIISLL